MRTTGPSRRRSAVASDDSGTLPRPMEGRNWHPPKRCEAFTSSPHGAHMTGRASWRCGQAPLSSPPERTFTMTSTPRTQRTIGRFGRFAIAGASIVSTSLGVGALGAGTAFARSAHHAPAGSVATSTQKASSHEKRESPSVKANENSSNDPSSTRQAVMGVQRTPRQTLRPTRQAVPVRYPAGDRIEQPQLGENVSVRGGRGLRGLVLSPAVAASRSEL